MPNEVTEIEGDYRASLRPGTRGRRLGYWAASKLGRRRRRRRFLIALNIIFLLMASGAR